MFQRIVFGLALAIAAGGLAGAQTPFDEMAARAACQDDAFRLCQATIPDRERTLACLVKNKDELSPACRQVLASVIPADAPAKKRKGKPKPKPSSGPVDLSPASGR